MRGKVILVCNLVLVFRITPAYAGKRSKESLSCSGSRDHPRLCGEKQYFLSLVCKYMGSPPPMRGKGSKSSVDAGKYRITPAYAGKSKYKSQSFAPVQDHPRLCGEKQWKI